LKGHTGVYLASHISTCLHEYGIHDKVCLYWRAILKCLSCALQILRFTADNASHNNTLVDELADLLDGFQGSLTRVCCFAHILNLVVKVFIHSACHVSHTNQLLQAILSQFSQKNKATADTTKDAADKAVFTDLDEVVNEDEDDGNEAEAEDDSDELEPSVEVSDNAMVDAVAAEADEEAVDLPPLTREEINLGRFAVTKVCFSLSAAQIEELTYLFLNPLASKSGQVYF
jgi:hypothetical protein